MKDKLLRKLTTDLKKGSLNSLAIKIGLNQPTLYRIINDKSNGSIKTWETIERYYSPRPRSGKP